MATSAESEARKAIGRLKRALEKGHRELGKLEGAVRGAEGEEFPADAYAEAEGEVLRLLEFVEAEGRRLQSKVLERGGLEPGRVRRSSAG